MRDATESEKAEIAASEEALRVATYELLYGPSKGPIPVTISLPIGDLRVEPDGSAMLKCKTPVQFVTIDLCGGEK